MAVVPQQSDRITGLIRELDQATSVADPNTLCQRVKHVLTTTVLADAGFLPAEYLQPTPDRYARRLLHKDPAGRYSVVIMVWDRGQGTPLHDHAGAWCVECVYQGRIRIESYDRTTPLEPGPVGFASAGVLFAGPAEAGHLIPPHEYHRIENPDPAPAVTIHVYSGEMTWCNAFQPLPDGGYRIERRELGYSV
jgi:3-mercaptopropionate dioxygenase